MGLAGLTRPRALPWRSKTVTDSANSWWFLVNRHEGQYMTLNPWRYVKPSQMPYSDGFLMIHDENFSSWINRFLVVFSLTGHSVKAWGSLKHQQQRRISERVKQERTRKRNTNPKITTTKIHKNTTLPFRPRLAQIGGSVRSRPFCYFPPCQQFLSQSAHWQAPRDRIPSC